MLRATTAALALASLAACASTGDRYPSLAIRDAERISGEFAVAPSTPEVAPVPRLPADTLGRIGALRTQAASAHQKFVAAVPGARNAVGNARGAGVEDDRWAGAQVALADLDSSRSEAAIALGDLDLLFADAAIEQAQREEIVAARSEVTALIAEEDLILAELRGALGQ
jgi:hypothetical protein